MENTLFTSHQHCFACGDTSNNQCGLGLEFQFDSTVKSAKATFRVLAQHQGYTGYLHGGIISTLLDAAMTHCLLPQDIEAMTAELNIRFHKPIKLGSTVHVHACMTSQRRSIYVLEATLTVDSQVKASATGKFIRP